MENLKIINEWVLRYDRPVSSIQIFSRYNSLTCDLIDSTKIAREDKDEDRPILDILVVNAINATIVFM